MYTRRQILKIGVATTIGGSLAMLSCKLSKKPRAYHTIYLPDSVTQLMLPKNPTRIILYTHGAGETRTAPQTDALKYPLILEMLANNWAILSHTAHGENWGNAASVTDYHTAISWAKTYTGLKRVDIFSQSMGAAAGLQVFAADASITSWLGIYPVCNLADMFPGQFKAAIKTAYNFSLDSDYATATAGHDPMLLSTSLFAGKKMKMWASYGDTVVSRANNADALVTRLSGVATISVVTATGDHGDPSHFNIPAAISFLNS